MALTAYSERLLNVIGEKCELVGGVTGSGSGTSTTVTVANLKVVHGAIATNDSSTSAYVSTLAGTSNQFVVTHGSGDEFSWLAWGVPKA